MRVIKIIIIGLVLSISSLYAQIPFPPSVKEMTDGNDKGQELFNKIKPKDRKAVTENLIIDPLHVKKIVLKNGLTVMLSENHDSPQVFGMVVVKAGGKNDPADATGLAHYLEHMLFKGTETMGTIDYQKEKPHLDKINDLYEELGNTSEADKRLLLQKRINEESLLAGKYAIANEMDKLLAQIGGSEVNAFTTEDFTAYHNTFPANQMERWLELYSHRFEKPVFRLFQSELETVYEEKNRGLDNTFGQVFEKFTKEFYKVHPYGQQTIIGSTEHLKNPPLKKMYAYFNTYYVANNMALVLSGDFNIEEIIPIIEQKFGDWRTGELPEFPIYEEKQFIGRELVEQNLTPIKVGILGFRTPASGDKDEQSMNIAMNILANEQRTGIIDKLSIDGKIMEAGTFSLPYNDHGATLLFFIPKIVGQKLEEAEKIILSAILDLKSGNFSEEYLVAIKQNMLQNFDLKWESNEERVLEMATSFTQNIKWEDYLENYNKIASISKKDIIRVSNKYLGSDYLCFYSKMGFPKNKKLDKPNFEPVIPENEVKSAFGLAFQQIPSTKPKPKFVDFGNDIQTVELKENVTFNSTVNPFNKIFDLEIKYGIGKYNLPILQQTALYLDLIGTTDKTVNEVKNDFFKLGASYSFEVKEESFSIHLRGNDAFLVETILLFNTFINNLNPDEKQVKKLLENIQMDQKFSRREPDYIAGALNQYALFGEQSSYKRELTKKELSKLTPEQLIDALDSVRNYAVTINYTGTRDKIMVADLIKNNFTIKDKLLPAKKTVVIDRKITDHNIIYLVDRKNSVQSQIYFNIEGKQRNNADIPQINAFNAYFGDDMSSIVFQEIREFRSLAYSAYGRYQPAKVTGENNLFFGYIGCQGDKTLDAISAMIELINNMPEKYERINNIKSALVENSTAQRSGFREIHNTIAKWKEQDYLQDPNRLNLPFYEKITFQDITAFYENEIKNKPLIMAIVGDSKRFDLKELEKLGEIIKVKESDLFVN